MSLKERIGDAIQRAATELPKGYDLLIEIKNGAEIVALYIPPVSDEEPGRRVDDFCGDDLADHINNAVGMAVEHNETHNAETTRPAVFCR